MAWNTSFTRFYSNGLAGLECGSALKIPRRDRTINKVEYFDGALEKGQCVNMIRVPARAIITDVTLTWEKAQGNTTESVLAVGDPYACGRFLGPVSTVLNSGQFVLGAGGYWNCEPWGTCGRLSKTSNSGDGCGMFYQYTCETDIQVINLHSAGDATAGGYDGGPIAANSGVLGGKFTGGRIALKIEYLDPQ